MVAARESIKLIHAALDEDEKGNIIARGVLSPESLYLIKVAPYQREVLPKSKIKALMKAFEDSKVPDIELGMRGGSYLEQAGSFFLHNDTYVIDGLQRISAARKFMEEQQIPRLGAVVHFNTTEEWERNRFRVLNTTSLRLSPNVLIRNMEKESEVVALLRMLCKDKSFVLYDKVQWNQRMARNELISAYVMLKTTGFLLSRFGPTKSSTLVDLVENLDKLYVKLGRNTIRNNIKTFWELMDECYRVRYVTFKEGATFLKLGFLQVMAVMLTEHVDFWRDTELHIDRDLRKKISTFPINDPTYARLAGAGGKAGITLLDALVEHVNSGKRSKRLVRSKMSYRATPAGILLNPKPEVYNPNKREEENLNV